MEKKAPLVQFTIGVACALSGAYVMFQGNIFGENNTGIAIVLGIIGIGLISGLPIGILQKKKV
jgi:hypothetical protein